MSKIANLVLSIDVEGENSTLFCPALLHVEPSARLSPRRAAPLRSAFPALPCLGPFRPLPRFGARSLSSNSHRRASSSSLSSSRAPFSAPMLLSRIRRRLLSLIVTKNCDNVFIVAIHCDNMAPWEFGQFLWRRNWACQARFREKGPGVSGPVPQEGESAPGGAKEMAAREARPRIT